MMQMCLQVHNPTVKLRAHWLVAWSMLQRSGLLLQMRLARSGILQAHVVFSKDWHATGASSANVKLGNVRESWRSACRHATAQRRQASLVTVIGTDRGAELQLTVILKRNAE